MIEMDGLNSWFPMKNTEVQKGSSIFFFIPWDPNKETWGIFFFFSEREPRTTKVLKKLQRYIRGEKKNLFFKLQKEEPTNKCGGQFR